MWIAFSPTLLAVLLAAAPADDHLGLRVPPGFAVTEVADSALANDIFRMTLDPRGRVVVAGRGYIRTLIDDDGDGRADRSVEFVDGPRDGAMGLLWEGDTLYVTGDGGLRRYRDRDGDGRADGPSELIRAMKTGGEHAAHAIRRGPDGWLYVICGNFTGIDASYAPLSTSPIKEPLAGCVIRFTPDLSASEIVADGFRNAYGMDFNPDGDLFAFDSDNERCVSLPWYEPTRFYHVVAGGHHGWRAPQRGEFWQAPPYDPDVARPLVTLGRGSPTGVACYRHVQFPARYRGGFFLLDWTFGKVHFVTVEHIGSNVHGSVRSLRRIGRRQRVRPHRHRRAPGHRRSLSVRRWAGHAGSRLPCAVCGRRRRQSRFPTRSSRGLRSSRVRWSGARDCGGISSRRRPPATTRLGSTL